MKMSTAFSTISGHRFRLLAGVSILAIAAIGPRPAQAACGPFTNGSDTVVCNAANSPSGIVFADAGDASVTIIEGHVSDSIHGDVGNDAIHLIDGTINGHILGDNTTVSGSDTIVMGGGSVTFSLTGFGGDDAITRNGGSVGTDVDGRDGIDTIIINGGNVGEDVLGGDAADLIMVNGGTMLHVLGQAGNDVITLNDGIIGFTLEGGDGEDYILLNGGSVGEDPTTGYSVVGGLNDDIIVLDGATTGSLVGNEGSDTIVVLSGIVTNNVEGHSGADTIAISGGLISADVTGGGGEDNIEVAGGADVTLSVAGNADNDTIPVHGGANVGADVTGGAGADVIDVFGSGTVVAQSLVGGTGNDTITLHSGAIGLGVSGGLGEDVIVLHGGTVGFDVLGGDDNDIIQLSGATISDDISGGTGNDDIRLVEGSTARVHAGFGDDVVRIYDGFDDPVLAGITEMWGGPDIDASLFLGTTGTMPLSFDGFETVALHDAALDLHAPGDDTRNLTDVDLFFSSQAIVETNGNSAGTTTFGGDYASASGVLEMRDGTPGAGADDIVTIQGDYAGNGATILGVDMAFDASEQADMLVIEGAVDDISGTITSQIPGNPDVAFNVSAGPTMIHTVDVGNGMGAYTGDGPNNGIAVVDVSATGNTADGDFVLNGGYVDVAAFRYTLDLESDGVWYLQSFPISGPYGDLPASMLQTGRVVIGGLWDRVGELRNAISENLGRGFQEKIGALASRGR